MINQTKKTKKITFKMMKLNIIIFSSKKKSKTKVK